MLNKPGTNIMTDITFYALLVATFVGANIQYLL